jgi:putative peptidoglycan lipid II flippase
VSYSLAAFPVLTKAFASGNRGEFVEQMTETSKHIIFWSIPISIMFIVLRAQIVRVILGAGKFNWDDTRLTAAALALFTVSLLAQNLVTLFVRAYYSRGKTQTPLLMNIISSVFIITLSYYLVAVYKTNILFRDFFESLLKVSDVPGTIVLMLPLGFSLGLILNVILHWVGFHKEFNEFSKSISRVIFQILGSSLIMGFVTYNMLNVFDDLFNLNTLLGIFLQGLCSGLIGIIIFIIVLYILKNKELVEIYKTLHRKVWNTKVISPDATLK